MPSREWIVIGVILTAAVIVGAVIALTARTPPARLQTLPMALPIPAGTVIRITNITGVNGTNGTIVNGSVAVFTVSAPGGRLVGEYYINGGFLWPFPSPVTPWEFDCSAGGEASGAKSLNNTLDPGTYALWIHCPSRNQSTPANPLIINVTQTIQVVYGAPTSPWTLPMSLPIPAGTVIRITNITDLYGTVMNGSIAAFTVAPPGGRLVGAAYMVTGGGLDPWPWPGVPTAGCPFYTPSPGTAILNDTLDPGTYGLWIACVPQRPPTPANPVIINVTETIQVVYG